MTVKEIIYDYLKNNNYDGLCSPCCRCDIDDLMPCGEPFENCIPAHKKYCKKCNKKHIQFEDYQK